MGKETYNGVNDEEVRSILRSRGYGIGSQYGFEFVLTWPTGEVRKYDGLPRRAAVGGPSPAAYARIKDQSASVEEVCDRIEALVKGRNYSNEADQAGRSLDEQVADEKRRREEARKEALKELGLNEEQVRGLKSGELRVRRKPGPKAKRAVEAEAS